MGETKKMIDDSIGQLMKSALYYLFISSRELFHSNFWCWLKEVNSDETVKLFSENHVVGGKICFKREHPVKNGDNVKTIMDVVIFQDNKPILVIENKVKDFPKIDQLDRIRKAFNCDSNIQFVLATLFWTKEKEFEISPWRVLTYQQLSERLVPEKFASPNSYNYYLIEDYKNLLSDLASIANLLSPTEQYDFAKGHKKDLYTSLDKAKLWEGYQKLRASHLIACFKNNKIYSKLPEDIKLDYGVNHKKATLDFSINLGNYRIGIQIEDKQFRRYINGRGGRKVAEKLLAEGIFFNRKFSSNRGGKNFLGYFDGDFSYQYDTLELPIAFDDLFEMIDEEFQSVKLNQAIIESCFAQIMPPLTVAT